MLQVIKVGSTSSTPDGSLDALIRALTELRESGTPGDAKVVPAGPRDSYLVEVIWYEDRVAAVG